MDENTYQGLVATINELALAPGEWPSALRLISDALRCHYAAAVATTPDRNAPRSLGAVGITADDHREFLHTWHKQNIYASRCPVRTAGTLVLGHKMLPRAEIVRSAMYRRYLAPREIQEVMRLDVFHDHNRSRSVTLARSWSHGLFTPEEQRFARALMPHLQRAMAVQVRLEDAAAVARAALDALETTHAPVLLLDRGGRVVHASAEAERWLGEADGLSAGPAGLRAATPALSSRLAGLIAQAAGAADKPAVSGTLRLPRPSGKPDLLLVAMPLRSGAHPGARRPEVLLQITDPQARPCLDQRLLAEAFGLTPAESCLAADLLRGLSVNEIAGQSGRSIATVRTHLASVLAKTGTDRQSELIRLLTRLPQTAAC